MNEFYTICGTAKPFLEWCNQYQAIPLQVRALMSLGVPIEAALKIREHRRIVLITLNKQTKSLTQWCQIYHIHSDTVRRRIEAGYTLQEAFESARYGTGKIRSDSKRRESDYTITKSFLQWCCDYAANPLHVRASMSMGCSLKYALENQLHGHPSQLVIQVQGQTDTFLRLCKYHKKAPNTIRRRVAAGLTLEDAFQLPQLKKGHIQRMIETGYADEYHCITQTFSAWCRDYHISIRVVRQRLEFGMDIAQALTMKEPGL